MRRGRWFQAWDKRATLEEHALPDVVTRANGQRSAPFGDGAVQLRDTVVGCESCEELFTPDSPHIALGLGGVEILGNGSGSHHELRKLNYRVELMSLATRKSGGVYLYANQRGCDGGRLYYDGSCMIFLNGRLLAQGAQFGLRDVEVVTATVDLTDVRTYRGAQNARSMQASVARAVPRVALSTPLAAADATAGRICLSTPRTLSNRTFLIANMYISFSICHTPLSLIHI